MAIGLNDMAVDGTYAWLDGSSSTFTDWDSGEPGTGDMVVVSGGSNGRKWMTGDSTTKYPFLCKSSICMPGKYYLYMSNVATGWVFDRRCQSLIIYQTSMCFLLSDIQIPPEGGKFLF